MKICYSILSSCLLFMEHSFVLIGRLTLSCFYMLGCTSPWFGSCLQVRLFSSSSSVDIASSLSTLADSRRRLGLPRLIPPPPLHKVWLSYANMYMLRSIFYYFYVAYNKCIQELVVLVILRGRKECVPRPVNSYSLPVLALNP